MARAAKSAKTGTPTKTRTSGRAAVTPKRPAKAKTATKASRTPVKPAAKAGRGAALAKAPARLGAAELRAQLEKLTKANANLRAKNREAGRAAKEAASRIAELEDEVARLENEATRATAAKRPRARRHTHEIDPGDSVPPGVAVEEPEPMDEEATAARDNLEAHLGEEETPANEA